ncbi:MAG: hypothetical protein WC635_02780 [Bacteriovorax sp.]|jgi:hypothetical protein
MITPVSPSFLKQEAKKLSKNQGIPLSKAYDEAAKKFGYHNYKHYLNESKRRIPMAALPKILKKDSPTIPVKISGRWLELFGDIENLKEQEPTKAYIGLEKIIKTDNDPFRRLQAAQTLLNNFDVPSSNVLELIKFIPEDHLEMLWPVLGQEKKSMIVRFMNKE